MRLEGIVMEGKRIASGIEVDPETGLTDTIAKQKLFFERAGIPNMSHMYNGTINLDISPRKFRIIRPDYEVLRCMWDPRLREPESFWLVNGIILFRDFEFNGYIYYPCQSPVKSHKDNIVEVLAKRIHSLDYGHKLVVEVAEGKIEFY